MKNPIIGNGPYFAAGGIVAALFVAGAAHAITDTVFKYSTSQTGYLTVLPAAFSPTFGDSGYYNDGSTIQFLDSSAHCFNAAVNLPYGSTITRLFAWYANMSDPSFHYVILRSTEMSTGNSSNIKFMTFNNTGGSRVGQSDQIRPPVVVNAERYGYSLFYCTENNASNVFYGARITYTYTNAGD